MTALAQNSDPFTYFASRPIRVCEGVAIDDGTLSVRRPQARRAARHADADPGASSASAAPPPATARSTTSTTSPRRTVDLDLRRPRTDAPAPFPVQVDGDYIGERTRSSCGSTRAR